MRKRTKTRVIPHQTPFKPWFWRVFFPLLVLHPLQDDFSPIFSYSSQDDFILLLTSSPLRDVIATARLSHLWCSCRAIRSSVSHPKITTSPSTSFCHITSLTNSHSQPTIRFSATMPQHSCTGTPIGRPSKLRHKATEVAPRRTLLVRREAR